MATAGFQGNVSPSETFQAMSADEGEGTSKTFIIDVRTNAEWNFVGIPVPHKQDQLILCEWQEYPTMSVNADFVTQLKTEIEKRGGDNSSALYFLCRSGVRSLHAAMAMSENGFSACFNIEGGFEGDPDSQRQRGKVNGWKCAGLPWQQN